MAMLLTPEQRMLADSAREFLDDHAPVAHLRALRDANDPAGFDRGLWRRFAGMGFNGILVPERHDGLGLGHVEAGIVLEAIGRNLTPSPFLATAVGATTALAAAGAGLQEAWLPRIAKGEAVAAIAVDEGARHRPERIEFGIERRGDELVLDGEKRFVVQGGAADVLIVAARDGLVLVESKSSGLSLESERLVDSSVSARARFDGVKVPATHLIESSSALEDVLTALRVGAAAELVGLAAQALTMTLGYLRERRQFGQPIGAFQALQHRAAHAHAEVQAASAAVLKAQQLLDAGDGGARRAALVAKGMAGLASALAVQEAVQMHGGIGMTDEYDVGLYMKRQRVLAELYGDADYCADELARLSGY